MALSLSRTSCLCEKSARSFSCLCIDLTRTKIKKRLSRRAKRMGLASNGSVFHSSTFQLWTLALSPSFRKPIQRWLCARSFTRQFSSEKAYVLLKRSATQYPVPVKSNPRIPPLSTKSSNRLVRAAKAPFSRFRESMMANYLLSNLQVPQTKLNGKV